MGKYESKSDKNIQRPAKRKTRKSPVLPILALLLICGVTALAVWVLTPPDVSDNPGPVTPPVENPEEPNDPMKDAPDAKDQSLRKAGFYTVLMVGTMDEYNTDTLMLASIDASNDKVNVISIPRDTMVDVEAKNKKINGAYGRDGIEELCKEVGEISGVYPDFYAVVNVESFIEIVDLVGGVTFNVPYDMYHKDADSQFTINLKKGEQSLDGKKALQMVRYRGTSQSDFGRMELQRQFLVEVAKTTLKNFNITQIKDMIPIISNSLETNMPIKDMIWFYINVISEINFDTSVAFHQAPVEGTGRYNGLSYVYLDKTKLLELINQTVNPFTAPITEDKVNIIRKES